MQHIGIDIIEISRIEQAIARWGDRFLKRVFTGREIELYRKHPSSLAARFAAKEAVMKALDAANKGIGFRDIEVLAGPSGKPLLQLYGSAQKLAAELGITDFTVSLSHSRSYAVAMTLATTNGH